jgi:ferredoxin
MFIMSEKKILKVETEKCITCWACVGYSDTLFDFNEDNKCIVKKQPETDEEYKIAEEVVNICPVGIISFD